MAWSERVCFALLLALTAPAVALAQPQDARAMAKERYQAGEARFRAGDYRGAIAEFRAANLLLPAPMNSYNVALAHERLGESNRAAQAYREFLVRRPDAPNRAEIEVRIAGLEGAAPGPGPESAPGPGPESAPGPAPGPAPARRDYDQRFASRIPAPGAQQPQSSPQQQAPYQAPEPQPKPHKAFYKHWAFWVVVGVGAIILIDLASGNGSDDTAPAMPTSTGAVILRF